ncbi:unnamed protein product [Zymoseptoria tritici ST99CH_1A5]|uniref:Glycoside hydrolase family 12 protein n=1 Tax=Zymoseptoria tritici ST99CH_1A5 TaxID=1276529 RepID=A0A1Y6LXM1_ZYMTR|nr:unnamed protein product [Zymoseptoria tritici ST99CH_1A5]
MFATKLNVLLLAGLAMAAPASRAAPTNMCTNQEGYSNSGYRVQNNLWGKDAATSGSQCSAVNSISSGGVVWSTTWEWYGGQNNVKSYAFSALEGFTKKPLSQINSMPSTAAWSMNNPAARCNVAYDLFTAADPNHATYTGDYELMVWLARYNGVGPIGSKKYSVNIGGINWDLYYGLNGPMKVYSYVAQSTQANFNGDIKSFFNHMTSAEGFPASSQNLITFQFGTEPFTGPKTTFDVSKWTAKVN